MSCMILESVRFEFGRMDKGGETYLFGQLSQGGIGIGSESSLGHGELLVLQLQDLGFDAVLDDQLGDLDRAVLTETWKKCGSSMDACRGSFEWVHIRWIRSIL
jgi:hypothetical protein